MATSTTNSYALRMRSTGFLQPNFEPSMIVSGLHDACKAQLGFLGGLQIFLRNIAAAQCLEAAAMRFVGLWTLYRW